MRSLRTGLIALWAMLALSAGVTGLLLVQFYRQSANFQVARAEDSLVRVCHDVADRYAFYVVGWHRGDAQADERIKHDLQTAVGVALARAAGIEGGIWQSGKGSLAYAFPTYEGTGPKTDVPVAELATIERVNLDA